MCIVETWLDNSVSDNELYLSNYQLFRLDRNRHGGGIAIYVHFSLSCSIILQGGPFDLEFLSISVLSHSSFCKLCLCLFYRPPSSHVSIFDNLFHTLQILNPAKFSSFLLLGDFNVNFCNPDHFLFSHIRDIMLSFSLNQVVPSYTHVSPSGIPSLIDLAMLANIEQLQNCTTIPPLSTSDHYGISLTLKRKTSAATPSKSRMIWLYQEGDFGKACRMIDETDWDSIITGSDVSKAAAEWSKCFLAIMKECIPCRQIQWRHNLPWLTKDVIQLIKKRNMLFRKAKRTKVRAHFAQYKTTRNRIVTLLRNKKQQYFNSIMTTDSKTFWKTIKMLNRNRETIPALHSGDYTASNDKEKADLLNTFFASCWNSTEQPLTEDLYTCSGLSTYDVVPEEVFHLLSGLDTSKANGPDGISAFMVKATASSIASPLAKLFTLSLTTGRFPRMWKFASIVPIPKSKCKNDPSNYRPVSLPSIVSKLLEKIVYSLLWEHLLEHAPISDCQWGFQKGKSTTTALLFTTHEWHTLLDRQQDVISVFFDFKKAFDSVPHRKLMERLAQAGFHPHILSWLCSYLSDRQQNVLVNGEHSQPTRVLSGVPQGSVLGPLLFLLYINDITKLCLSPNTRLTLYADDMLLYKPVSSDTSYAELQQDINLLSQWSDENMLSFNTAKCKCMLLTNKRNISHPTIMLNNEPLEYVQQYKYLGVIVSHNLCWSHHIQEVCSKARRTLGIIYRNIASNTNDPLTVFRLYIALVRPHLEYAAQVWSPHLEKDIHCLEKVQKFALRICTKTYHESYDNLLDLFKIPSLQNRRLYLSLCTFYCIKNKLFYFPYESVFPPTTSYSCSRSYNHHVYRVPFARSNGLRYSFFCNTIRLWNNLPLEAINSETLFMFKHFVSLLLQ